MKNINEIPKFFAFLYKYYNIFNFNIYNFIFKYKFLYLFKINKLICNKL